MSSQIVLISQGHPTTVFSRNAFKLCFRSGVLALISVCAKKNIVCSVVLKELEYFRIHLGFFGHFPKTVGFIAFPKMIADLFLVP